MSTFINVTIIHKIKCDINRKLYKICYNLFDESKILL